MKRLVSLWIVTGVALTATPRVMAAQELTDVSEIVQRANLAAYYAGDDGRARVRIPLPTGRAMSGSGNLSFSAAK
jgi:hypothetical protein